MDIFEHRGRAVAFDQVGSGPPVVFLHNAGTQRRIWDDQVAALAREHRVYALDLPGYGESEQPADGYRLADYVAMLDAFLDAHRLTEVVLVGNCLGSATSLSYAIGRPDRVRALVLINPLTWDTVSSGQSAALAWADARLPLGPLARRLALPGRAVSLIVANQLGARGRRDRLQHSPRLRAHWSDRGRLLALHGLVQDFPAYAALDRFDPPAGFPPICTIWGRQNRVLSARAGARLSRRLRAHTAVELPDCGHLPMVEDPERVTSVITDFLAEAGLARIRKAVGGP
ncbi:pimeloyl-ACP methyl ester carboxylesterase [Nocardia tenerifensis]|uniref:Pimeloyl-ACP methyl ester carboxylesterase n=1 Tax=Nocardia tenerifensis TaxID=228006 RepID=A0A318KWI6_9NOCA|nr:alpha/beta fold hydrolase [Nocardia tenerifensis]PXX69121.1 pimeloyl-ACP methyl ester carboxylesterase [Nocardia tenerifensis]